MDTPPTDVNESAQTAIAERDEKQNEERMTVTKYIEKQATITLNGDRAKEFTAAIGAALQRNPRLKQVSPSSLIGAAMACVLLDIVPETPQQLAFLIPYGNAVQFQLGYKGLIELAFRSGQVTSISAELVFPKEEFKVQLGSERKLTHIPDPSRDRTQFDEATHVYATATLTNGVTVFDVMNMDEIRKIRDTVKAKSTDAPWRTWPEQMAKKTVIKRLTKYLPQSRTDNRLQNAAAWDSWAEAGKLKYEEGKIVEGKTDNGVVTPEEPKKIQALVEAPPATDEPPENVPSPFEGEDEESAPVLAQMNVEELKTGIQDMVNFLSLKEVELIRIYKEIATTIFPKKMKRMDLVHVYEYLEAMTEKRTEELADNPEPETTPLEDVQNIFGKDSEVIARKNQ